MTLARSARTRTGAAEGAAVRDADGRTYVGTTVALPSLEVSAMQAAVVAAVASGARSLEAAAVVGEERTVRDTDLAVVGDLTGEGVTVITADATGAVSRLTS